MSHKNIRGATKKRGCDHIGCDNECKTMENRFVCLHRPTLHGSSDHQCHAGIKLISGDSTD